MRTEPKLFLDSHNLLVHHDGDGGDTAADIGTYAVGNYLTLFNEYDRQLEREHMYNIWKELGFPYNPVRHPYQEVHNDPEDFSFDQMNSNVIGMGLWGFRSLIRKILGKVIKNRFRFPNGDPATLERLNVFFRALGWWWLYPLFLLGDFWLLIQFFWLIWKRKEPSKFRKWLYNKTKWNWLMRDHGGDYGINNVGDCRNYRLILIQANLIYGTWFSGLALLLYDMYLDDAWTIFFQKDNRLDVLYGKYREQT